MSRVEADSDSDSERSFVVPDEEEESAAASYSDADADGSEVETEEEEEDALDPSAVIPGSRTRKRKRTSVFYSKEWERFQFAVNSIGSQMARKKWGGKPNPFTEGLKNGAKIRIEWDDEEDIEVGSCDLCDQKRVLSATMSMSGGKIGRIGSFCRRRLSILLQISHCISIGDVNNTAYRQLWRKWEEHRYHKKKSQK
jgi:hypothetical protein